MPSLRAAQARSQTVQTTQRPKKGNLGTAPVFCPGENGTVPILFGPMVAGSRVNWKWGYGSLCDGGRERGAVVGWRAYGGRQLTPEKMRPATIELEELPGRLERAREAKAAGPVRRVSDRGRCSLTSRNETSRRGWRPGGFGWLRG